MAENCSATHVIDSPSRFMVPLVNNPTLDPLDDPSHAFMAVSGTLTYLL